MAGPLGMRAISMVGPIYYLNSLRCQLLAVATPVGVEHGESGYTRRRAAALETLLESEDTGELTQHNQDNNDNDGDNGEGDEHILPIEPGHILIFNRQKNLRVLSHPYRRF